MRVTIAHEKGRQEATRIVDKSADELIQSVAAGPVKIQDAVKKWDGNTMMFSFHAKMGLFGANIHGSVEVNEKDVVIDVELPGLSGNAAAYKLRAQGYRGQIVTLSANASADARDASLRAGANHYLTKPLELERFVAVMRRAIGQDAEEPT